MSITVNKKAFHDFSVEEKFEAGIALQGWEVKAIRAGRMNIKESYVIIKSGEIFLIGMHISPLTTASSHNKHDPVRTRKLLLHRQEIMKLIGKVERSGYAVVPIDLHFVRGRIKLEVGLAKGKKQYDKRQDEQEKAGKREAARAMKEHQR